MPPKDAKKKGGAAPKKEIDSSLYVRKASTIETKEVKPKPPLSGFVKNIETLFPEWSIDGENWAEPLPADVADVELAFPSLAPGTSTQLKSIKALLGLDTDASTGADPKGKAAPKKADPKKGAPAAEMVEEACDESGRALPRVFLDSNSSNNQGENNQNEFELYALNRGFRSEWSAEQVARREYQKFLLAETLKEIPRVIEVPVNVEGLPEGSEPPPPEIITLSDEEVAAKKAEIQNMYDQALAERDVEKETPCGSEIDPIMCSVFKLISRFAPSIIINSNTTTSNKPTDPQDTSSSLPQGDSGMEYLWKAIYPKMNNGRPCYNPAGKYYVRLFLGGKWRKVPVSDSVPVDENGVPVIASSSDPLELWPTILAKAVYTAYVACGYGSTIPSYSLYSASSISLSASAALSASSSSSTLLPAASPTLSSSTTNTIPSSQKQNVLPSTKGSAMFAAFAMHVLTGWQPGAPWSVGRTVSLDSQRARVLFQEMIFNGVPLVPASDIPGDVPTLSVVNVTGKETLKTQRQFQEDYRRRMEEREAAIRDIATRESKIERLNQCLTSTFSECFTLTLADQTGQLRTVPVLGISYAEDTEDLRETKILIDWVIVKRACDIPRPESASTELSPFLGGLDQPLPPSTILQCEWVKIKDLVINSCYAVGFETLTRLPSREIRTWHWTPAEAASEGEKGGKGGKGGKEKDNKDAASSSSSSALVCCDQGNQPPTLLVLDTASFYSLRQSSSLQSEGNDESVGVGSGSGLESGLESSDNVIKVPKASHLSVSVFLHADLISPLPPPADNTSSESSSNKSSSSNEGWSQAAGGSVLVLQELRSDKEEPIVMRFELSQKACIPITRLTYHIPAAKINPDKPMIFWVRLFTKASLFTSFGSGVNLSLGSADKIWKDLGFQANVFEGEAGITQPLTEQLLFRIPMSLQSSDTEVSDDAFIFCHVSDREIASNVSLLIGADPSSGEPACMSMPRMQGAATTIYANPNKRKTAIGRCFPREDHGNAILPGFKWKVFVLTQQPIINPVRPVGACPVTQRFNGSYIPNNQLVVCRDVITVDKQSFPLAIRFNVDPLPPPTVPDTAIDNENGTSSSTSTSSSSTTTAAAAAVASPTSNVYFAMKLYRKSDRKLVCEYYALRLLQLYDIPIKEFLQDGEAEPVYVPADPKGGGGGKAPPKKDDKKGKGGNEIDLSNAVQLLMEVSLDATAMHIPDTWKSRFPFTYDALVISANTAASNETTDPALAASATAASLTGNTGSPQFRWQLDILAGNVLDASHDIYDLQSYAAMKNSWEEASEGRFERAMAANAYIEEKLKAMQLLSSQRTERSEASEGSEGSSTGEVTSPPPTIDKIVESLALALGKEAAVIRPREELLLITTVRCKEHIIPLSEGEVPIVIDDDMLRAGVEARAAEKKFLDDEAIKVAELLDGLNDKLRAETKERIKSFGADALSHAENLAKLWGKRESYRLDIDQKNAALKLLLEKASEAIHAALDAEDEAANPGKAKKKPPPKKK